MKVYGLIVDAGDGSSYIEWHDNIDIVNKVMEEDPDIYYANEDEPSITLTFNDDVDLKAIGIRLAEVDND
jgi:hypothetical protein